MDFWIIRDGKKAGPFRDYEIREKIENRELDGDDPAWSEGMADWLPLKEISVFRSEFERPVAVPPPLPPVVSRPKMAVGRRVCARIFDHLLSFTLCVAAVGWAGGDLKPLVLNPWIWPFYLIPLGVLEALLIHRFGATPGKALMGLRVLREDGARLSFSESLKRTALVYSLGFGMGVPLLLPVCLLVNLIFTKSSGNTLWDARLGTVVASKTWSIARSVVFAILTMAVFEARAQLTLPVLITSPEVKNLMNSQEFRNAMPKQFLDFYDEMLQKQAEE